MIFLAKGRLVTIADDVAQKISLFTVAPEDALEAGGILLGRYRGPHVEVLECTIPMPDDRRSRYGFVRQDKGHQRLAKCVWLRSGGTVNFVGEWHTHPERNPSPSWIDRRSWRTQIGTHKLNPLVFVIAGSAATYCEIAAEGRLATMEKVG